MGILLFDTRIGPIAIEFAEDGVEALKLAKRESFSLDSGLYNQHDAPGRENALEASLLVKRYFDGEMVDFSAVKVNLEGRSDFFREVCVHVRNIPCGSVRSYADVATILGSKKGARAVGRVMAENPIPIIIPCHRVVASDGALRGYSAAGGLGMKEALLKREGVAFVTKGRVEMDLRNKRDKSGGSIKKIQ